jgi:hypothetical protein
MVKDGQIDLDWENEIIAKSCLKSENKGEN